MFICFTLLISFLENKLYLLTKNTNIVILSFKARLMHKTIFMICLKNYNSVLNKKKSSKKCLNIKNQAV